jgi:hypothetical protein
MLDKMNRLEIYVSEEKHVKVRLEGLTNSYGLTVYLCLVLKYFFYK